MVPTLLIGLGGFSSKVVADVYKTFHAGDRLNEERDKFSCRCIDFDSRGIQELHGHVPYESIVDLSLYLRQPLLESVRQLSDDAVVPDWFDAEERFLSVMGGANRETPISRMDARVQWMRAERDGRFEGIVQEIRRLAAINGAWQVQVHIVGSLAGNTGSGIFLQTACYIKKAFRDIGRLGGTVHGYFLMGEAFAPCGLPGLILNQMRANTYASLKEMDALASQHETLPFEFCHDQTTPGVPTWPVFDTCYLMEHSPIGLHPDQYCRTLSRFIQFAAVTDFNLTICRRYPLTRESQRSDVYSKFAVSKLIYPADDLFAVFARKQVLDEMRLWCLFDKEFEEELASWKNDLRMGIPHQKPSIGAFFMDRLYTRSLDSGCVALAFREIYRSTQLYEDGDGLIPIQSKASRYAHDLMSEIRERVDKIPERSDLESECRRLINVFQDKDVIENDVRTVHRTKLALADYWRMSLRFIENTFRDIQDDCHLGEDDAPYNLNSVILKEDGPIHPLAVRYFLYDLKGVIVPYLDKNRKRNDELRQSIESFLKADSVVGLTQAWEESRNKRLTNLFRRDTPRREWIYQFVGESNTQITRITDYLERKLVEQTLSHLLEQVNLLLEESEQFFKELPQTLEGIEWECNAISERLEKPADGYLQYVFASSRIQDDIYDTKIRFWRDPLLPQDLSVKLYRRMLKDVILHNRPDRDADLSFLRQCVDAYDRIIREDHPEIASKNVIDALREEAKWEKDGNRELEWDHIQKKFQTFRDQARIWGPNILRRINAWGFHPDCIQPTSLSQAEVDYLFGDTNVFANPDTAASRLPSDCFSPFEIIRVNTAHQLSLRDFSSLNKPCPYYSAYAAAERNPHLDKRWRQQFPDLVLPPHPFDE